MSFRSNFAVAAALGALAIGLLPAVASAEPAKPASTACFLSSNWEGWRAASPTVIYFRVRMNEVYRVDLSAPSWELQSPDVHLVSKIRGSDWICQPLDLDLSVADDHGVGREPLFVKSISKLTPDEVAAIPPKFRP